jgi:hypothetical protein
MNILSYSVKQPQTGDKGSVWFPALEFDLQYLNDHTHDGTTGAPIPATNIAAATATIAAAGWVAVSGGTYRQLVTVANGKNFSAVQVTFRDSTTFQELLLGTEAASATTYYVHINDNSITLTASYRG